MTEEFVTVKVAQGTLKGRKAPCRGGGLFYSFQGVPFAKPPVGPLRFKDPQPVEAWEGVRDALKEGDNCAQLDPTRGGARGSDDCLYLNVYAPETASVGGGGPKLPVMVWIHGGGFVASSGDSDMYGVDYFMPEDVIVVTINYRLGALGFLYLGHPSAPGNYGLKDQVAALRWVKQNIAAFGGDPKNVTIFGGSAGGASVHYQMLSPLSKGLFHRAIAQSGAAICPWANQYEPVETAKRLAKALGCSEEDPEKIVAFLRTVDAAKLATASVLQAPFPREKKRLLTFSFVPTPEVAAPDAQMFLPAPPQQLVDEGRHHQVPFITGFNSLEALLIFGYQKMRNQETSLEDIDAAWEETVLPETRLAEGAATKTDAARELRRFFLGGQPLSDDTLLPFQQMMSDLTFNECANYCLKRMALDAKEPIYLYHFNMDGYLNVFKKLLQIDQPGACHGDDAGYLFRMMMLDTDLPEDDPSFIGRRRMIRMWTNFAKTGDPTPGQDPLLGVRWIPYTSARRRYLEIGDQLELRSDLLKERFDFWEKFYASFGK